MKSKHGVKMQETLILLNLTKPNQKLVRLIDVSQSARVTTDVIHVPVQQKRFHVAVHLFSNRSQIMSK